MAKKKADYSFSDADKTGVFKEMSYISVGDPYKGPFKGTQSAVSWMLIRTRRRLPEAKKGTERIPDQPTQAQRVSGWVL